jgi:hypothetical protein
MTTSRSLICLLENQNGGKLQKDILNGSQYVLEIGYINVLSIRFVLTLQ